MGVIPTIAPFLLPAMLPQLRARWPDLKLYLREETSQAACDALHRGQLDCVLLAVPYACGDVEMLDLFEDELLLAFPPNDQPPPSVTPDTIDEHRLLLLEDGHCLKDHALAACNRPQLRAEARMLGTSLHTLVQMVDNGLGLTFVPQDGGRGRNPGRHGGRHAAARRGRDVAPDRAGLAPRQPARGGIQDARRSADRGARGLGARLARFSRRACRSRLAAKCRPRSDRSGRRSSPWSRP